jgi:hypothetical protein
MKGLEMANPPGVLDGLGDNEDEMGFMLVYSQ